MLRTSRARRATIKARTRQTRAAARIQRRGNGSLQTHALAAGITGREHRVHAGRRMRATHRYTRAEVAAICLQYKPRRPAFKIAAARLALAA